MIVNDSPGTENDPEFEQDGHHAVIWLGSEFAAQAEEDDPTTQ
jgi:hypothetical protein